MEEADEKLTILREEKEEVIAQGKKDTENAITDIRERMTKEKELLEQAMPGVKKCKKWKFFSENIY